MIAPRSDRRRAVLWLSLLSAAARVTAADAAPAAAHDGGLAEAKQDYQAIKAAGRPGVQQSLELPRIPAPTLPSAADTPRPPPSTQAGGGEASEEKLKQARRNENWLVDAMMAPGEREAAAGEMSGETAVRSRVNGETPPPSGRDLLRDRDERADRRRDGRENDRTASPRQADSRDREAREKPAFSAPNPLDTYMAAWMTPADRALLLDHSGNAGAGGREVRGWSYDQPSAVAPADLLPNGPAGNALPAATSPADVPTLGPPAENPFLQPLGSGGSFGSDFAPAASLPPEPAPAPSFTSPTSPSDVAPARPADSLADQLKARDDADRAFRQLKRF